ncbi:NmrA family NAD(P)-binding protein [Pantoea anthophila]|uniref:NmrA family NAD(P)-binding protein n=1 Tax=Pantoea anthophila TaxID=470931 RepID=UPI002DB79EA4|nr:NmrA family NAD(P)-binding protein [Pantoea anthophila]MEB6225217.1 NmrA family NAD(P)-binding protein [Pantoea anthophila]
MDVFKGDLLGIDSLQRVFCGVDTLFLLNAVTGDEFTQALITLNVAREAGIDRVVYLSVFDADKAVNVPHFAVKFGAERMPETLGLSATILRPAYFIDNEAMIMIADVVRKHNVYPMPIGSKGVAMVDARDIAEIAAIELIRRDRAAGKLPVETINIVGPDILTGADVAAIWTEVLGRPIAYGGDDPGGFEASMANFMPVWMAYEMRIMAERYVSDGMIPQEGDRERLVKMPGRNLHSYRETALALAG